MTRITEVWAEAINAWAISLRSDGLEETSIRTRTDHVRWLAVWCRDREPWDLELEDLQAWMGAKTWARETRRAVRASLRRFFTWAVRSGRMEANPTTDLPAVRASHPSPHPAPDAVYRQALADATPRERLMLRLAAECGLRRAEVAQVHSRDLMQDLGGYSLVVHGKGRKERVVPLRTSLGIAMVEAGPGYLFPGEDGGHLSPRWVGKLIARLLPGEWTMHSLRHRFATLAYAVDRDTFTVQDLLGHASPATTRRYVRLPDDAKRRLIEAVSDVA